MIQCIRLGKQYKIEVNQDGKFTYEEAKMSIKDVPIIRVDFEVYDESAIKYIIDTKAIFRYSTVLIEIHSNRVSIEDINRLKDISENCAMYIYIDITDDTIDGLGIEDDIVDRVDYCIDKLDIDGISLVDKTSKLNAITAKELLNNIADQFMVDIAHISICNSPLSYNGYACLTAVKARELMAKYSIVDDVPLPTANHEKSCCGCIQYIEINHDIKLNIGNNQNNNGNTQGKTKKKSIIKLGATRF